MLSINKLFFINLLSLVPAIYANHILASSDSESVDGFSGYRKDDSSNVITGLAFDSTSQDMEMQTSNDLTGADAENKKNDSFWHSSIFEPMRISLSQEFSYKIAQPEQVIKNRSSIRLEYSEPFLDNFSVQIDAKTSGFYYNDHRTESDSDTNVTKAYLQANFFQTNIKVGVQTVAWGESLAAIITDEVSPRDNREFANLNLDEVRVGQPMVILDQYSNLGRWSFFYIPDPDFDENPASGSLYDPFSGRFVFHTKNTQRKPEYGASWRDTFGSIDVSVMAARLVDNQYAFLATSATDITREPNNYSMAGITFTYIYKDFLFKGEFGKKAKRAFNDDFLQTIFKRDTVDASLGIEYAPTSTFTLMLEAVEQHIVDWDSAISTPADRRSYMLIVTKKLMNEDLSLNFFNIYNKPYSSNLAVFITSYKWNDNVTLELNAVIPETNDDKSALWFYRDQKQIGFKFQYQF